MNTVNGAWCCDDPTTATNWQKNCPPEERAQFVADLRRLAVVVESTPKSPLPRNFAFNTLELHRRLSRSERKDMDLSLLTPFATGRSPALAPPTRGRWLMGTTKGADVRSPFQADHELSMSHTRGSNLVQVTARAGHLSGVSFPVNAADLLAAVREVCDD